MSKFYFHTIAYGESIHSIAQRYLGNATRWQEIVILNNLEYPFITTDFGNENPRVRKIGEKIAIPVEETNIEVYRSNSQFTEEYDIAFGKDISLFNDSVISHTYDESIGLSGNVQGDLKTVRGFENLKQSLGLRLSTPLGSLVLHPNFGSRLIDLLGKKMTYENIQKIKIEIERTIRCDRRVEDIEIESTKAQGDALFVRVKVIPLGFEDVLYMNLQMEEGGIVTWD